LSEADLLAGLLKLPEVEDVELVTVRLQDGTLVERECAQLERIEREPRAGGGK